MSNKMNNLFTNALMSNDALTNNGAVAHSTTGSKILDYFSKSGSCRGRKYDDVVADLAGVFGESLELGLKVAFYNRMVTRKAVGFKATTPTETVQKGQGQRDEFVKTLKYLEFNHPEALKNNLFLVPVVGRWSDLWYDSAATNFFHYVDTKLVYELVKIGLSSESQRPLIAKYLPKIRSKSNCTNERHNRLNAWAKGLCQYLGWDEQSYRKFKSDPDNKAHTFQRLMSGNRWDELNFNSIPGKALFNLIGSKKEPLKRHNLEQKYIDWIKTQPVAKFTGYVYELFNAAKSNLGSLAKRLTFDKQFEKMLQTAKDGVNPELLKKGVLCAIDTSGSMSSFGYYSGKALSFAPIDVCCGLGIFFSTLLEGAFKDTVVMFDAVSKTLKLTGTFTDKVKQLSSHATAWGNTNFQSVIDEIVRVRKSKPNIPVSEYPGVLLVVSDMSLDNSGGDTNYNVAMKKLAAVGLPPMTIIWWNVTDGEKSVPNKMDDNGVVMISGWDGTIVSKILEAEAEAKVVVNEETGEKEVVKPTPYETMIKCLDQEVLRLVKV